MQQVLKVGDEVTFTQKALLTAGSLRLLLKVSQQNDKPFKIVGFEYQDNCYASKGKTVPEGVVVVISCGIEMPGFTGPWYDLPERTYFLVRAQSIELTGPYSDGLENWI